MENHILVWEKSGHFKVDLLCEPWMCMVHGTKLVLHCIEKDDYSGKSWCLPFIEKLTFFALLYY